MPDVKSVDLGTVSLFLKVVKGGKELTEGESPRKGCCIIDSFSIGAGASWNPAQVASGGGVSISALTVSRKVLPSTAELFKALLEEENLDSVEMLATQKLAGATGKDSQVVFTIKLEKARCTGVSLSGGSESAMMEACTFEGVKVGLRHEPSKKEAQWDWGVAKR